MKDPLLAFFYAAFAAIVLAVVILIMTGVIH